MSWGVTTHLQISNNSVTDGLSRVQYQRTETTGCWRESGLAKFILVAAIKQPQSSPVRLHINVADTLAKQHHRHHPTIMSAIVEKLRLSLSLFVSTLFSLQLTICECESQVVDRGTILPKRDI